MTSVVGPLGPAGRRTLRRDDLQLPGLPRRQRPVRGPDPLGSLRPLRGCARRAKGSRGRGRDRYRFRARRHRGVCGSAVVRAKPARGRPIAPGSVGQGRRRAGRALHPARADGRQGSYRTGPGQDAVPQAEQRHFPDLPQHHTRRKPPKPPPAWEPALVVARAWTASLAVLQALGAAILSTLVFGWWVIPPLALGACWLRRRYRRPGLVPQLPEPSRDEL